MPSQPATIISDRIALQPQSDRLPIVVVGAGPVGVRLCQQLQALNAEAPILLFGDEPWKPYDRIQLSALLAGDLGLDALALAEMSPAPGSQFVCRAIVDVDAGAHRVTDSRGQCYRYSKLVFATGSSPHRPTIPGIDLPRVYTFRDMSDALSLSARQASSRHTVVIGGGLLGLEAARAMRRANTRVTVVQQSQRLMNRQLDTAAAQCLQRAVEAQNIQVLCGSGVGALLAGDHGVRAVQLRDGTVIPCDTVIVAAGIRPNVSLALRAGVRVHQGIVVDDQLRTSDPDIFAVGECAEHAGQLYGLVAPGFEQAAVLSRVLQEEPARYQGSLSVSRLKVLQESVFSAGEADVEDSLRNVTTVRWRSRDEECYRKLVLRRGRVVGAIAMGPWPATGRVQEGIASGRVLPPWARWRFLLTGDPWGAPGSDLAQWPDSALVCNCRGVSCGRLREAMDTGCRSVDALQGATQAGTVCGSCVPLLVSLCSGEQANINAVRERALLAISVISGVVLALLSSAQPVPEISSCLDAWREWQIWRDGGWKQVTGFSLLALMCVGLLISLSKRWQNAPGRFTSWRKVHVSAGLLCLVLLIAHTGLHWGEALNQNLMLNFTALAALGILVGGITATEHWFGLNLGRRLRRASGWLHLLLFWPLPTLIGLHILSVYYF